MEAKNAGRVLSFPRPNIKPLAIPRPGSEESYRGGGSGSRSFAGEEESVEVQIHKMQAIIKQRKSELRTLKAAARLARCESKCFEVQIGNEDVRTLHKHVEDAEKTLVETLDYRTKCLKHLQSLYAYSAEKMTSERTIKAELQKMMFDIRTEEQKSRSASRKQSAVAKEAERLKEKLNEKIKKNQRDLEIVRKRAERAGCAQPLTKQERTLIRSSMPHIWQKLHQMDPNLRISPGMVQQKFLEFAAAFEDQADTKGSAERTDRLRENLQNLEQKLSSLKRMDKEMLMHESETKWDRIRKAQADADASKVKYAWLIRKMMEMKEAMSSLTAGIAHALDIPDMLELPQFKLSKEGERRGQQVDDGMTAWKDIPEILDVLKRAIQMLLSIGRSREFT
eukprot:jgi/Bigna1/71126/fgenesh1_pg.14_\